MARLGSFRAAVLSITVLALLVGLLTPPPSAQAIWNGAQTSVAGYPFMVSLRSVDNKDAHKCGGTMINSVTVLTAAHCLNTRLVAVVNADNAAWPTAPKVAVQDVRINPSYPDNKTSNQNDMALLRLSIAQKAPTVGLAFGELVSGSSVRAVGWGCTVKPGTTCTSWSSYLKQTDLAVAADSACPPYMSSFYAATSICTKGVNTNINSGDSGGPLLFKASTGQWLQLGVASVSSQSSTAAGLVAGWTTVGINRSWIVNNAKIFADCARAAGVKSQVVTPTPTAVTFSNKSGMTVKYFWRDYSGVEVYYATLLSGQTLRQPTYATHPWVIRDTSGHCHGFTVAGTTESSYTIY